MSIFGSATIATAIKVIGSIFAKKKVGDVAAGALVDIFKSKIPLTKEQEKEAEIALANANIKELKVKGKYIKSMGTKLRDSIIPGICLLYGLEQAFNFFMAWRLILNGQEAVTVEIDPYFAKAFMTLIGFLFVYKASTQISEDHAKK